MGKLLSGLRLLVVEDEMLVLLMIEDMLFDLGCASITSAARVDEALALIDTQTFDAAMLDMNLGGYTTNAVADALTAEAVPFIFSTGYSGHEVRAPYQNLPVLKKPFGEGELAQKLKQILPRPDA